MVVILVEVAVRLGGYPLNSLFSFYITSIVRTGLEVDVLGHHMVVCIITVSLFDSIHCTGPLRYSRSVVSPHVRSGILGSPTSGSTMPILMIGGSLRREPAYSIPESRDYFSSPHHLHRLPYFSIMSSGRGLFFRNHWVRDMGSPRIWETQGSSKLGRD